LLVVGVEQSYVDDDPTHLEFEYMQHMALVLDIVKPDRTPLRAVHLGGGALTMARWLAATHAGCRQLAFESDAEVLEAVRVLAPVDCEMVVDDAVHGIAELPEGESDVVIWDLYDGPRAVTDGLTLESVQSIRQLLDVAGVALLNVSDATPFDVVRPVLAALCLCFDDVALLAEPATLRGRRSGNCVLVGTVGFELPHRRISRAGSSAPVRARVLAGSDLGPFIDGAVPATLANPLPPPDSRKGRAFL
jgi:hypothetical protein